MMYRYIEVRQVEEKLKYLISLMLEHQATDVHFTLQRDVLSIQIRGLHGMQTIADSIFDKAFFQYLKYFSDLELANAKESQSGRFTMDFDQKEFYFRFSIITTFQMQTGVLRILNNHSIQKLEQLTFQKEWISVFKKWSHQRTGLILFC